MGIKDASVLKDILEYWYLYVPQVSKSFYI